MALNGKMKFTKINSQNYANILYSDSDSDEIPDLKLPPIRGKKSKRRKVSSGQHGDTFCSLWTALKLLTGIVVLVVLIGLAVVCFWSLRRIEELQDQISALENTDKSAAQMLKFQTQLAEVNASLTNVKTGQGSLQELSSAVADIQNKLKTFETAHTALLASVSDSKKLLDLPQQVQVLSETVAAAGSEIKLIKNSPAFNLQHRISALETLVKEKNSSPSSSLDKLELNINESLTTGLQSLRQVLDQQSTRISVLEDFTKSHSENAKLDTDIANKITELVNKLLEVKSANLTTSDQKASSLSQIAPAVSSVEKGEFLVFKSDVLANFEKINQTINVLSTELDAIADRLDSHDSAFINLTMALGRIKSKGADQTSDSSRVPASVAAATMPSNDSREFISGNGTRTVIHINGINTREDLHQAFVNSWPLENNQLDINVLSDLEQTEASKEDLTKFDADANGFFTEEEMANALGFHHNPR